MKYQIAWYDGFGGKPDYSRQEFDTPEQAASAAESAIEKYGSDDIAYGVVTAKTHRRIWLSNGR